jgi:TolA-binding protein
MQADPARNLLSQYVALNYTSLAGEKLDALVEEGGELMVDVSNKLVRLLATKTSQVCSLEDRIGSLSAGVEALQVICNDKETEIQLLLARQETELQSRSGSKKQKKSGNLF